MMFPMGIIHSVIRISNPRFPDIAPIETHALVDSACIYMVIPETVRAKLQLEAVDKRPVMLADGTWREVPYVGPIDVRFEDRHGMGGAMVMGDQVILGAIAMEDMDLVITPKERRLEVNPNPVPCRV